MAERRKRHRGNTGEILVALQTSYKLETNKTIQIGMDWNLRNRPQGLEIGHRDGMIWRSQEDRWNLAGLKK